MITLPLYIENEAIIDHFQLYENVKQFYQGLNTKDIERREKEYYLQRSEKEMLRNNVVNNFNGIIFIV